MPSDEEGRDQSSSLAQIIAGKKRAGILQTGGEQMLRLTFCVWIRRTESRLAVDWVEQTPGCQAPVPFVSSPGTVCFSVRFLNSGPSDKEAKDEAFPWLGT